MMDQAENAKYEAKSVTPVDDYKWTLSNELKEIAENELRETDELRNFSINAMRDWVVANPKITATRMDSMWFLKHLRCKKFSLPMAQEIIERHMVLRQGDFGSKLLYQDFDITNANIMKIFNAHPVCFLPECDPQGRKILLFRIRNVNPVGKNISQDVCTAIAHIVETISEHEENQIRGIVYIFDVSGMGLNYLNILPIESWLKLAKYTEKCLALRHKGLHIVNLPPSMQFLGTFVIKHATEKIRQRVHFHRSIDEITFIKKDSLPKEYGGTIPMKELAEKLFAQMYAMRSIQKIYCKMQVKPEMYPKSVLEGSVEMLKVPLNSPDLFEKASRCSDDSVYGVQGSFRKLEID